MAWVTFALLGYLALTGAVEVLAVLGLSLVVLISALMGLDAGQEVGKLINPNKDPKRKSLEDGVG